MALPVTRTLRHFCIRLFQTLGVIVFLLFLVDRSIVLLAMPSEYRDKAGIRKADVILVPGARVYGGEVSAILGERLNAAIELYQAKKAPRILVSGDYSSRYYDEASAMNTYLKRHGISASGIILDHAGYSTYDSLYRAKSVFGFTDMIIVTQDFHLPRALFIAKALGIDAVGFNASRLPLLRSTWLHNTWREPLARLKAIYDIIANTQPSFSGSGLPLDAKGNVQRD